MPIIDSDSGVTPGSIKKCRPTLVKAWAYAIAEDKTYTRARRDARKTAIRLRDKQRKVARTMPCPGRGGCPVPCRRRRPQFSGMGYSVKVVRKKGGPCKVTYKTYWTYRIPCYCPYHLKD